MSMQDLVGQTLGQYQIEAALEAGGMGEVFRGRHLYLDRRIAAIKVMSARYANNPQFRARFLQEAKSAAALKHPHIVDVYDFGEDRQMLYLVMELVTGGSLRTFLQQRAAGQYWPLFLELELVRQAAEGLAAAHAQNVIHRDIKPDNLLLNRVSRPDQPGEQYQLKIADFGLARLAEGDGLTSTGAPMGTFAYMSPEQCRGEKLDGRSDLYSLGVVLYEVVTGYKPFQADNFLEALNKHTNMVPSPPSQIRPDLPDGLEEIILRGLAKNPAERFASGTALATALQSILGQANWDTPVASRPPERPPTAMKTIFQPLGANQTPAPEVQTLPGPTGVPRVRVLDQNGQTLQMVEVTQRGLLVGRQSDSDLVLKSEKVSRQHLQIGWDGVQVTVKDLGSSNGTLLEGARLLPQVSQVWQDRQQIHVGPFWLRLEGSSAAGLHSIQMPTAFQHTALGGTSITQRPVSPTMVTMAGSSRIGVLVSPEKLTLTPGQATPVKVTLANMGSTVDWFAVAVEGAAPEWVQGAGQEVQLNPSLQETIELNIDVPRIPQNLARDYPVTIRARSREKPEESGTARSLWSVLPFKEDLLDLTPRRVRGRGRAVYTLLLRNGGNTPTRYELRGEDDEQKMSYSFGRNPLDLQPGEETHVGLRVGVRRRWFGREEHQPFQIRSRAAGSSSGTNYTNSSQPGASTMPPLESRAEFINVPMLPSWLLAAMAALLLLGGLATAFASSQGAHGANLTPTTIVKQQTSAPRAGTTPTSTTGTTPTSTAGTTPTSTTGTTSTTASTPTTTTAPPPPPPSPPGTTWTVQNSGTLQALNHVAWSGSLFVAAGNGGTILTSSDGNSWTPQNSNTSVDLLGVNWVNSMFVAVGKSGMILTSSDGSSWTRQGANVSGSWLAGIAWSGSTFVAVGSSGEILTSPDGSSWTRRSSGTGQWFYGVVWSGSQFVVMGGSGTILESTDGSGTTWTASKSGTTEWLNQVAWSGSMFVAVGTTGTILTSTDGSSNSWTRRSSGTSQYLLGVTWSGSQFVIVGATGTILTSTDGITWIAHSSGTSQGLFSVIWSGSQFVVVGGNGTILTSS